MIDEEGPRWSPADWSDPDPITRIEAVSEAAGFPVVGIIDEKAGGIVGYVSVDSADALFESLERGS